MADTPPKMDASMLSDCGDTLAPSLSKASSNTKSLPRPSNNAAPGTARPARSDRPASCASTLRAVSAQSPCAFCKRSTSTVYQTGEVNAAGSNNASTGDFITITQVYGTRKMSLV